MTPFMKYFQVYSSFMLKHNIRTANILCSLMTVIAKLTCVYTLCSVHFRYPLPLTRWKKNPVLHIDSLTFVLRLSSLRSVLTLGCFDYTVICRCIYCKVQIKYVPNHWTDHLYSNTNT